MVFGNLAEVVVVDERGTSSGEDDADGKGDEHQTCDTGRVPFAELKDNGVGDEEHVEKTVEDRHVQGDEEDDEFAEEELKGANHEDGEPG